MLGKAALVVVAPLLIATGCDGSKKADPGCTPEMPRAVAIKPPAWGTLVRMCASDDGTEARVDNLSSSVIDVSSGDINADMNVEATQASSPSAQAVQMAVPATCVLGSCVLAGGRTLDVTSESNVFLNFRIDDTKTVIAHFAEALGSWVPRPGPGVVGKIASCADDVNQLATPGEWQEDVRYAVTTSQNCGQLAREVVGAPQPDEGAFADRITSIARRLDGGIWIDTLSYETAKILASAH